MASRATLYRTVSEDHVCPYGLKAKDLLRRKGFEVDDRPLTSRAETEAFKAKYDVKTTPQVFFGEERIGGYEALRRHLGLEVKDPDATTYQPVIAIFATTFATALAMVWAETGTLAGMFSMSVLERFVMLSMVVLAIFKLRDLEAFSSQFLGYDLLARRWVPYAYVYPFAEAFAGVGMLSGALVWLVAPVAITIGTIGAVSVVKAVYVDGRELKCACVGGNSNVPLGFISLTENLMMMAMGAWMLV